MTKKSLTHRPPHISSDDTYYFITVKVINDMRLFNTDYRKKIFVKILNQSLNQYHIKIFAWVLMSNHYHILIKIIEGNYLELFIRNLHSKTAIALNKIDKTSGRKIWYQYWDKCINKDYQFWKAFNYIHHNPVKHGLYKNQADVLDYEYCSYKDWVKKRGIGWVNSIFEFFPNSDYTCE